MFREALALLQPPPAGGRIPELKPLADRIMFKHAEYKPFLQNASSFVEMQEFLMDVVGIEDIELVYGIDERALESVKAPFFLFHPLKELPAPEGVPRLPKHFISRAYALSLGLGEPDGDWEAFLAAPSLLAADGHSQTLALKQQRYVFSVLLTAYSKAIDHGGKCHEDHIEACSEFRKQLDTVTSRTPKLAQKLLDVTSAMPLDADPIDFCEIVRSDGLDVAVAVHVEKVPLEYARATS